MIRAKQEAINIIRGNGVEDEDLMETFNLIYPDVYDGPQSSDGKTIAAILVEAYSFIKSGDIYARG